MRTLVVFSLALVAVSASVQVKTGYHNEIGIPTAEKIRVFEEQLVAEGRDLENLDNKIVGGALAPTNAYPYFAGLLINFWGLLGQSVCGSSLVSANRLVTAAHCWFDGWNQASQFTVILGTNFLYSGGTRIITNQVIMHPQWNSDTLNNDIAMIYLPSSVAFSVSIQPIAIPNTSELWEQFTGHWAFAAGFGRTSDLQVGASSVVSHVSLQVIGYAQCFAIFGPPWVQQTTICTNGAGGVGICGGDSGGPLAVNYNGRMILIGVSSFVNSSGCQLGSPSAFARVTSFQSFINQHL